MNTRKRDKAEIQATALSVVVAWLRNESHGSEEMCGDEIRWCCEAQERIAIFVELEAMKLRMKSKTLRALANNSVSHGLSAAKDVAL